MKLILYFVSVVCALSPAFAQRNFRQSQQQQQLNICYTPENNYGICVGLTQCPAIVTIYSQSRGSPAAIQYLRAVQRSCGTRNIAGDPIICCGEFYNNLYGQTTPRQNNPFTSAPTSAPRPTFSPPQTTPRTTTTVRTTRATQPPTLAPLVQIPDSCEGPDGRPGQCVDLRNCPTLLNSLINDPSNNTLAQFLRSSNEICYLSGFRAGNSVCCPVFVDALTQRPTSPVTPAPTTGSLVSPRTSREVITKLPSMEEGCGLPSAAFRKVVGGENAKLGNWPWIALLAYDVLEGSPFKCGGSLISKKHILTAAHCIRSDLKYVRLGEHDLSTDTETKHIDINIARVDRHPDYNKVNGKNDIAILHMELAIEPTELIRPTCVPTTPELRKMSFVGYTPFVAGWGRTMEGGTSAQILQQLQIPVFNNTVCQEKYAQQRRFITPDQFDSATLCAGVLEGGMDTCQGDSGGPLMTTVYYEKSVRFHVIGIVSYGVGCARADIPGVYTNVANFADWIQQKVAVP